jgi:hypothetical protein
MKKWVPSVVLVAGLGVACLGTAVAEVPQLVPRSDGASVGVLGVHLGAGADITGGMAYGGQLDYTIERERNAFELGLTVFVGAITEDSDNGNDPSSPYFHEYHEETDVLVIAATANYLIRYAADLSGPYFLVGAGVGAFSVEWTETSATDTSLGPRVGTGSMQSEDGTSAGALVNLGIGTRINEKFDLRLQVPTFIIPAGETRDGGIVPTMTITAGLKF